MAEVAQGLVLIVAFLLLPVLILAGLVGGWPRRRSWLRLSRRFRRPEPSAPGRRPLQLIAHDVHRISERYHQDGMRFAQYEGRRRAFDRVLAEAAEALEIPHLLHLLPPGPERDCERSRVEARLVDAGLLPHRAPPA